MHGTGAGRAGNVGAAACGRPGEASAVRGRATPCGRPGRNRAVVGAEADDPPVEHGIAALQIPSDPFAKRREQMTTVKTCFGQVSSRFRSLASPLLFSAQRALTAFSQTVVIDAAEEACRREPTPQDPAVAGIRSFRSGLPQLDIVPSATIWYAPRGPVIQQMIQEFRYVAPGGLLVALILAGLYLIDPTTPPHLALLGVLASVALGWVCYQWVAYLRYREGGLESHGEMRLLREILTRSSSATTIVIPYSGARLALDLAELVRKLQEQGRRYFGALAHDYLGSVPEPGLYTVGLHNLLFAETKEHDYARASYGAHQTLTVIYWVFAWGFMFLLTAVSLRLKTAPVYRACFIVGSFSLCLLLALLARRRLPLPGDFFILVSVLHSLTATQFLGVSSHRIYVAGVAVFLAYLLYKARTPWRMMRIEAELQEEFMTWLYEKEARASAAKADPVATQ